MKIAVQVLLSNQDRWINDYSVFVINRSTHQKLFRIFRGKCKYCVIVWRMSCWIRERAIVKAFFNRLQISV